MLYPFFSGGYPDQWTDEFKSRAIQEWYVATWRGESLYKSLHVNPLELISFSRTEYKVKCIWLARNSFWEYLVR